MPECIRLGPHLLRGSVPVLFFKFSLASLLNVTRTNQKVSNIVKSHLFSFEDLLRSRKELSISFSLPLQSRARPIHVFRVKKPPSLHSRQSYLLLVEDFGVLKPPLENVFQPFLPPFGLLSQKRWQFALWIFAPEPHKLGLLRSNLVEELVDKVGLTPSGIFTLNENLL